MREDFTFGRMVSFQAKPSHRDETLLKITSLTTNNLADLHRFQDYHT